MVWAFLGKVALSAVASPSKAFLGARLEDGDHIYPYDVGKKMSESTNLGMVSRVYTTHKHIVFKVVIHSDLGDGFLALFHPHYLYVPMINLTPQGSPQIQTLQAQR